MNISISHASPIATDCDRLGFIVVSRPLQVDYLEDPLDRFV
jgi:hypothetical protein